MLSACADFEAARGGDAAPQPVAGDVTHFEKRLCPEILLGLAPEIWAHFQEGPYRESLPTPPYWSLEWPGGQALARYILDHPEVVAGKNVVDWGAGSGLVAIAAALAGARLARAIDRDPRSVESIRENAILNGVGRQVLAVQAELPSPVGRDGEIILAADLWYDRFDAMRITSTLRSLAKRGQIVLIADTDRAFTPRGCVKALSRYSIPTDARIERTESTTAYVARLEG